MSITANTDMNGKGFPLLMNPQKKSKLKSLKLLRLCASAVQIKIVQQSSVLSQCPLSLCGEKEENGKSKLKQNQEQIGHASFSTF